MQILKKISKRNQNPGQNKPVVIAFIGDSVTHGAFEVSLDEKGKRDVVYDVEHAYPHRLKSMLDQMYPAAAVSILNCGVAGECSYNGESRFERDVLAHKPDLIVIAFALNDSINKDQEVGLERYRKAMASMLSKSKAVGIECIVLTPNHMCSYVPSSLKGTPFEEIASLCANTQSQGILAAYVQAARETAQIYHVPVADAYQYWEQMAVNGVDTTALLTNHINHPSREAHGIFVQKLMEVFLTDPA